ncbi:MAG: fused MFS/spermidine synthase [bacterium]
MSHRIRLLPWHLQALLFFVSGIPALVYQVSWQRKLILLSGVGNFSVSTIIAAFMVGIGLGSALGGHLTKSLGRRPSLFCFALVELGIGLAGLATSRFGLEIPIVPHDWYTGRTWQVVLAHLFSLVLPTTLMGMTFPLLTRALVQQGRRSSHVIGTLYALNLAGSALGSLASGFFMMPALGISGTFQLAAFINFSVALAAVVSSQISPEGQSTEPDEPEMAQANSTTPAAPLWFWYLSYTLSGFCAIGLEIVWFRMVDIGTKATSYTFSLILCIYLAGMALGTLAGNWLVPRLRSSLRIYLLSQAGVVVFALVPVLVLCRLPQMLPFSDNLTEYWRSYEPMAIASLPWGKLFIFYFYLPMLLFLLPTFCMGLSFVALQDGIQTTRSRASFRLGMLQALNIAGCIAGSLFVGLAGLDWLKSQGVLVLLFSCTLLVMVSALGFRGDRLSAVFAGMAVALSIYLVPPNDLIWQRFHGQTSAARFHYIESEVGVISLLDEGGRIRVSNNAKGQSYIPFGGVHSKLGALPSIVHGNPANIAIIGLGSGDTAWAAGCLTQTTSIDVYEICPDQWRLLQDLSSRNPDQMLRSLTADPRFNIISQDGRIGILQNPGKYDMIEADAIRPNGSYAGNLYSTEFYTICRDRLKPGGIMCTWAPTPRSAITFRQVFPHVIEMDGGQILMGSNQPLELDNPLWSQRLNQANVAAYLGAVISRECLDGLKSARVMPPLSAAEKAISPNTDDHPLDEFEIPQPLLLTGQKW